MNKELRSIALYAILHSLVIMFFLAMIITGLASPFINGFAIDSEEKLYVGEGRFLRIYQDGVQVGALDMSLDAYAFMLNSKNELIVAYPSVIYRMDTTGNILERWEDSGAQMYQKIRNNSKNVTSPSGDEYRKVGELGWTRILKNGTEEVYRLSILSFVVKLLMALCIVSYLVNGFWLFRRFHSKK